MGNANPNLHNNQLSLSGTNEDIIDIDNINEGIVYVEGGVGYKKKSP